jgi:hypothetical protein
MIGHDAQDKPGIFVSAGTLSRLVNSGVITPGEHGFGYLYLRPIADDVLAQELRLRADSPLAIAERRLGQLEDNAARTRLARRTSAERFRGLVRWIVFGVLLLLLAVLGVLGGSALLGAPPVILLLGYEVLRLLLDWSRPSLVRALESAATEWADRRLKHWTEAVETPPRP